MPKPTVIKNTTFDKLLVNLRKFFDGEDIESIWFNLYNIYKEDPLYKDKLEEAITGFYYSNIPERLNKKNLEKLYGNTLKTSISRLKKTGRVIHGLRLRLRIC